jgi:hypothetical protein
MAPKQPRAAGDSTPLLTSPKYLRDLGERMRLDQYILFTFSNTSSALIESESMTTASLASMRAAS